MPIALPARQRPKQRERAAHLGPERRREPVLDAALSIAVDRGVGAVTLGAVAEHLLVTRPVVYACFGDRVEMMEALLARESQRMLEGVLAALHSARGDEPEAAFVKGYQSLLRLVAESPDSWRLMFAAHPDPMMAKQFALARTTVAASAARWIRPALRAWWNTPDLERKLPVLVELFMCSCEAAIRLLLEPGAGRNADDLGQFLGRSMCRAFAAA